MANQESGIDKRGNEAQGWANYEVNKTSEPQVFAQLAKTGSFRINIPLPLKPLLANGTVTATVADTNYYKVRMEDVRVTLLPQNLVPASASVSLRATHGGASFFSDKNKRPYKFVHEPVPFNQLKYRNNPNSVTGTGWPAACFLSEPYCDAHSASSECNKVYYSPFGSWTVDSIRSDHSLDLSKVTSVVFSFKLRYYVQDHIVPTECSQVNRGHLPCMFGKPYHQEVGVEACTPTPAPHQ